MRIYKIKTEEDLKKIQARNIEPIQINEVDGGWEVGVEEDINIEEILKPPIAPPVKEKTSSKSKPAKKKKKKK